MAQLLLQVAHDRSRPVSRARPLHSVHEAEEHASLDDGRGPHHALGTGVLRLSVGMRPWQSRRITWQTSCSTEWKLRVETSQSSFCIQFTFLTRRYGISILKVL